MKKRQMWWVGSNLAYPIAGLWTGDAIAAVMLTALGIASAIDHWRDDRPYHLDVAAIYAVLFYLIALHWGVPPIYIPVPAFAAGWFLRMRTLDVPMEYKVATLAGLLLVFGLLTGASLGYAAGVLVVALAIRQWVDHGLWHLVTAFGLALVHWGLSVK